MRYLFNQDDRTVTTCPDCGSTATFDDSGLKCANPDCKNS